AYDFSTSSKAISSRLHDPGNVYIFLSSEADGTSENRFTLRHEGAENPQESGQFNTSINYVLRIVPEPNGYGTVDGSSYFTGVSSPTSIDDPEWLKISGDIQPYNNNNSYVRWYNRGTIELAILSDEQDTPQYELPVPDSAGQGRINLASGTYTSNIYVHVVTDFN
ncbi:MAG: hypothetical protein IJG69_02685, partial [Spirochaetales bacterium]|nr:hypothetical protein [Spirochaetales bacterium]